MGSTAAWHGACRHTNLKVYENFSYVATSSHWHLHEIFRASVAEINAGRSLISWSNLWPVYTNSMDHMKLNILVYMYQMLFCADERTKSKPHRARIYRPCAGKLAGKLIRVYEYELAKAGFKLPSLICLITPFLCQFWSRWSTSRAKVDWFGYSLLNLDLLDKIWLLI